MWLTTACRSRPIVVATKGDHQKRRLGRPRRQIVCQKGFGGSSRNPSAKSKKRLSYKQLQQQGKLNPQQGWLPVGSLSDFEADKKTYAVLTSTGVPVVLYKSKGEVFCSDANSTAYRFPMNDARVFDGPEGPAAECPLDGTTYDLKTGRVIEWCPKDNPLRSLLGMLKSKEEPKPLSVYEVVIADDGVVFAKLF